MADLKDFPFESTPAAPQSDEERARAEEARKAFEALEGGVKKDEAKPIEEKPFKEEGEGSAVEKAEAQKALDEMLDRSIKMAEDYSETLAKRGFDPSPGLAAKLNDLKRKSEEIRAEKDRMADNVMGGASVAQRAEVSKAGAIISISKEYEEKLAAVAAETGRLEKALAELHEELTDTAETLIDDESKQLDARLKTLENKMAGTPTDKSIAGELDEFLKVEQRLQTIQGQREFLKQIRKRRDLRSQKKI
ncbi:MAG: hypothetical protein AAB692_02355 [Patescibacteria group bacterium]